MTLYNIVKKTKVHILHHSPPLWKFIYFYSAIVELLGISVNFKYSLLCRKPRNSYWTAGLLAVIDCSVLPSQSYFSIISLFFNDNRLRIGKPLYISAQGFCHIAAPLSLFHLLASACDRWSPCREIHQILLSLHQLHKLTLTHISFLRRNCWRQQLFFHQSN